MKKGTIDGAVPLVAWAVPDARNGTARIIVAAMRTAAARGTRSLILGSAAYDPCSFGKSHFAVSGSATTARTAGLISRQRPPREARRPHPARAPDGRPGEGRVPRGRPLRSSRTRRARSRATLTPRGRHFVEQRETFADERGQILRLTRRHQVPVDDDLLIDDVRADELEVALDRRRGRRRSGGRRRPEPGDVASAAGSARVHPRRSRAARQSACHAELASRVTSRSAFVTIAAVALAGLVLLLVVRPALERGGVVELVVVVVAVISILLFERWLRTP